LMISVDKPYPKKMVMTSLFFILGFSTVFVTLGASFVKNL